eukprot:1038520-Prymnesium_polylepis.2
MGWGVGGLGTLRAVPHCALTSVASAGCGGGQSWHVCGVKCATASHTPNLGAPPPPRPQRPGPSPHG